MFSKIRYEKSELGSRALLECPLSQRIHNELLRTRPEELVLNRAEGWRGDDIEFVRHYTWLKSFIILDFKIEDVYPIHALKNLVKLEIITYCKTKIDFLSFPFLKHCSLEWRRGAESIFECRSLESLFINRYKGSSSEPFARLTNLKKLSVLNAPLNEIENFKKLEELRSLRIANLPQLTSLFGLDKLKHLRHLDVSTCKKIDSLEPLSELIALDFLSVSDLGDIPSLRPIRHLKNLDTLLFTESTNIKDGDISILFDLPQLKLVSFMNRRHYSNKREEFARNFT